MRKKLDYDYCSASPILEWLGDKWALVVLLKLHENGVIRFNELYKTIPSISEKMLSTVLRSLVTDGLVGRKIYPSVPPKVEYYVSEFGETLIRDQFVTCPPSKILGHGMSQIGGLLS